MSFQKGVIEILVQTVLGKVNVMLVLPTGCGKSLMLNVAAYNLITYHDYERVIILVTDEFLASQHQQFFSPGEDITIKYGAGDNKIIYASV